MTRKTDAWMPLWIGDYLADTQHLTRDEHGAYLLLLMAYWRNAGPIPDDDRRLAAIVKASPKEWKTLRPVMLEFFRVADGAWHQKRMDAEIVGTSERAEKAASKAKRAAEARWKQCKVDARSNAPSIPQAVHEECPSPSPSQKHSSLPSVESRARDPDGAPTLAGKACRLMREAGVQRVNPSDPRLSALLAQGVTPRQLGDLAIELREAKGDVVGQAYVIAAMAGRLRDAASQPETPPGVAARASPAGRSRADRISETVAEMTGRSRTREVIDVEAIDPAARCLG